MKISSYVTVLPVGATPMNSALWVPVTVVLPTDVVVERISKRRVCQQCGTTYDAASFDDLHAAMKVDKKARGSQLRFVVLDGLAQPVIFPGPDEGLLTAAYAEISG